MKGPKGCAATLYGLQNLAEHPDKPVLLVEGEKTADAAAELFPNYVVVTWPGGSNAIGKVDAGPLYNRNIILWPDNDEPGKKTIKDWQMALARIGMANL